ncbi:TPA: hypothetical protein VMX41_001816 [Streptococcus pyogenes]|nr:hypothetical protein [Streptococcus pyogenes]
MSALAQEKPKRLAPTVVVADRKAAKASGQGKTIRRLGQLAKQADAGETVKLTGKSDEEILKALFG